MNPKIRKHIDDLKTRYAQFPDHLKEEIQWLEEVERKYSNTPLLASYREHEISQKLLKSAMSRYSIAFDRVINDEFMSQAERTACFACMEWAKWYIDIVSEDPEEDLQKLDQQIIDIAKRNGLE